MSDAARLISFTMETTEAMPVAEKPNGSPCLDQQIRLGRFRLPHPFIQAALSGYSDWPMRALSRRHGAAYSVAEVMIDRFVNEVRGTGKTDHYFHVTDEDHPVGAQLMGADPAQFAPAARRLVSAGFDVIDINFGCPVKSALGGCRGGYHLGQPVQALEIISRVRDAVPESVPVTVKMRRGIRDDEISRDDFFRILHGAFARGVAAVTVHGRTVEQKYRGPSRWEFLREVKQAVGDNTIFGSGDLFDAPACLEMLAATGVDGVTIARGSIGNPWIFKQCLALWSGESLPPPPDTHEQAAVIAEHRALAEQIYGSQRWLGVLRRFAFKYARLHPRHEEVRTAMGRVKTENDWNRVMDTYYAVAQPGRYPEVNEAQA